MHISKRMVRKSVLAFLSLVLAVMLVLSFHSQTLGAVRAAEEDAAKRYYTDFDSYEEEQAAAREFNEEIAEESYVLMKNANNTLPLQSNETMVSLFGVSGSQSLVYGGAGSGGGSVANPDTVESSLQDAGFSLNPRLLEIYSAAGSNAAKVKASELTAAIGSYSMYDGAAIIVISRTGSEFNDAALWGVADHSNPLDHTYSLTDTEKDIIRHANTYFDKVIVVVNSAHVVELGDLNDAEGDLSVDAIVWMGDPGVSGAAALGRILKGEVNPSGHTSDVYPRAFSQDPTWPNYKGNIQSQLYTKEDGKVYIKDIMTGEEVLAPADTSFTGYEYLKYSRVLDKDGNIVTMDGPSSGARYYNTLDYEEGIYMGYRWYETAYADFGTTYKPDGYTSADEWYNDNVVYPFGYGLSYTDFDWEIVDTNIPDSAFTPEGDGTNGAMVKLTVRVTNTGSVAGKDVGEIYFSAPYTSGGIEKSAVTLVDFAKSKLLQPGESQDIEISFRYQDMASFDYSDANDNDFQGYELEKGKYTIGVYEDSHTVATKGGERAIVEFEIGTDKRYTKDSTTDAAIETLFTPDKGDTTWDGTRADGQWYDSVRSEFVSPESPMTELSRADFVGTWPKAPTKEDLLWSDEAIQIMDSQVYYTAFNDLPSDPWYVAKEDIPEGWTQAGEDDVAARVNEKTAIQLWEMSGVPFEDAKWDTFMNQLTYDEMRSLITSNRFNTPGLEAIGKDRSTDADGPAQLSNGTFWTCCVNIASTWNTDMAYKQGRFVGNESLFLGVNGWYGPGMNIHRNPAAGRNFEYYSQDGLHSGMIAAAVIKGATDMGMVVYMKHLFMNDQETNRYTSATFASEQAIREIYAKPWELAIKDGNANASMGAFNRIGLLDTTSHYNLYEALLKQEFGFIGSSVTDMFGWGYNPGSSGDMGARVAITPLGTWNDTFGRNVEGVWDDEKQTVVCTFTDDITNGTKWTYDGPIDEDHPKETVSEAMNAKNPGDYNTINRGGSAAYVGMTSLLKADNASKTLYKEGDTIESYTQWAAVRIAAQRLLWAQANGNNSKNGVNVSAFEGKDDLASTVGTTVNESIAPETATGATITSYAVTGGTLPEGLTISSAGVITGMPTRSGEYNFTVTMTADTFVKASASFKMQIASGFTLSANTAEAGEAYTGSITSETVSTSAGYQSVKYSVDGGALPEGLTMDANGAITGTPASAGTYNFTVKVDASKRSGRQTVNYTFYEDFAITVSGEEAPAGKVVAGFEINEQGNLIVTYTDNTTQDLGKVVGKDGVDGAPGQDGADGADGADGTVIKKFEINDKGELVVTFGDNTTQNLGKVVGEDGKDGQDGQDGQDGKDGEDASGCGSVIGTSSAVFGTLILAAGVTVILAKKRTNK